MVEGPRHLRGDGSVLGPPKCEIVKAISVREPSRSRSEGSLLFFQEGSRRQACLKYHHEEAISESAPYVKSLSFWPPPWNQAPLVLYLGPVIGTISTLSTQQEDVRDSCRNQETSFNSAHGFSFALTIPLLTTTALNPGSWYGSRLRKIQYVASARCLPTAPIAVGCPRRCFTRMYNRPT